MSMAWNRGISGGAIGGMVCVATLGSVATTAHAQMGMMMQGAGGDISITRKGFEAYVRILGLDADQKEVAKDLMDGNRAANKSLMEDMQAKMRQLGEKARESGDWQAMQKDMPAIAAEFAEKSEKLQTQFFDDLKGLLNEQQMEKFPAVERHRRRELSMRFGLAFGANTDVVEIVRLAKIDADSNEEMKAAIERYELDLDSILKGYEKLAKDSQKGAMEGGFDPEKIEAALKPLTDASKQIRDINRAAVKRVAALITDEQKRAAFELEVKRIEFPRIYREAHVQKSLAAALKLADLDESQKSQLTSVKEQYERDAASVNERWAKALEDKEEKAGGRIKMLMNMWQPEGEGESETAKAKKARNELDENAAKRLESILKEDQKAQLPQKRPEKGGGMWGGGMFEDFGWEFGNEEEK
jgi:hypothetical protein